jgi:hypothetical protein
MITMIAVVIGATPGAMITSSIMVFTTSYIVLPTIKAARLLVPPDSNAAQRESRPT